MRRSFCKAASISLAAYTAAVLSGFAMGFRLAMFAVAAVVVTWTLFCTVRAVQLGFGGAHGADALTCDRESYGFALGGSASSWVLLCALLVLTQLA